jgi:hypothetical protein
VDNNNNCNSVKLNIITSFGNLNNIVGSSTSLKTIKRNSISETKNDNNINEQLVNYEEMVDNEPNLKFNSTFKKLSIDLNDEPTEFNLNEICVNNNENPNSDQPKILVPIVLFF